MIALYKEMQNCTVWLCKNEVIYINGNIDLYQEKKITEKP